MSADDYITKLFGMQGLIARVQALLRRIEHIQQTLQAELYALALQIQPVAVAPLVTRLAETFRFWLPEVE